MTHIPRELAAALAGHYEVEREIGRGGMATVYLARDVKHGRAVALKVLRPDLSAVIGNDRFLNEIEIAAQLNHPHIVPLYDSGRADGFLYYVMPYVEGTSLRGLMNRGQVDLTAAVSITVQVADALSYAHTTGVLHRDIKPENILLSGSHAYVTDFGIAKALSTAGAKNLTRSGFPLGTVGYMSPEQAAGVKEIDERSDVYGMACVLYEMLVGDTPGLWLTEEAVKLGRFVDAEPGHREKLDRLPGRLEQVLARALAMKAGARHATPRAFAEAVVAALGSEGMKFRRIQVEQIVGRAAELQGQNPTYAGLISIGALEQIAAEVGIAPNRVRQAVAELGGVQESGGVAPPDPVTNRQTTYSDTDVRRIIERAVELEDRYSREHAAITIGGLEEIAAEIGILPERVREAAAELERGGPAVPETPADYGKLPAVVINRTLAREIAETEFAALVVELRQAIGVPGTVWKDGDSLVWSTERRPVGAGGGRNVHVVITPRAGETTVHIEERLEILGREVAGSVAGWVGGGLIGIAMALGFGALEAGMVPLFGISFSLAGAYIVHRSVYENTVVQRKRQLEQIVDRAVGR